MNSKEAFDWYRECRERGYPADVVEDAFEAFLTLRLRERGQL